METVMEIRANECYDTAVTDRFDELRDDMDNGFSKLRKNLEEMDADELRRDVGNLMMIGHSQMDTIRQQRREIDGMQRDLLSLHKERASTVRATLDLLGAMGVAYDVEDDCPAKWLRMAASVARERRCEPVTTSIESLGVTDLDRKESMTEIAMTAIMGVFVLCVVVWTAMMVVKWA